MPTYEYRCNACKREFEYQQRMSDPDLVTCEACGADQLEKLISWTSFQLKGGGWYKDLYSSNPAQAAKDSVDKGKPPAKDGASASAASTDGGGGTGGSTSSDSGSSSGSSGSSSSTPSSSSGGGGSSSSAAASRAS